ncbi:MAG: N-acetyltransferase [Clostridiales bacterium]|nr:N-acetyltransferase [Clostridiales bacterium]
MIRPAAIQDLPAIEKVYAAARAYMVQSGNPHQWGDSHPARATLESDIEKGDLYVCEVDGEIRGAFALLFGTDPTYSYIEDGAWPNEKPYATIHRIASDGQIKGIFTKCFEYALTRADEIRIDTHHDNKTMQHVVSKHGFRRCGIIYLANGDPRIAYQYSKE